MKALSLLKSKKSVRTSTSNLQMPDWSLRAPASTLLTPASNLQTLESSLRTLQSILRTLESSLRAHRVGGMSRKALKSAAGSAKDPQARRVRQTTHSAGPTRTKRNALRGLHYACTTLPAWMHYAYCMEPSPLREGLPSYILPPTPLEISISPKYTKNNGILRLLVPERGFPLAPQVGGLMVPRLFGDPLGHQKSSKILSKNDATPDTTNDAKNSSKWRPKWSK